MRLAKLCVCLLLFWAIPGQAQNSISLTAHQDFGLSFENSWTVRLSGLDLTVERPNNKPKPHRISERELSRLRQVLEMNSWDTLRGTYGRAGCNDCPRCVLEVKSGSRLKRIVIYGGEEPSAASSDVGRFLSMWQAIKAVAGLSRMRNACP
jgi:hypothetical protein